MKDPREYDRDYLQWKEDLGGSWPVAYGVVCSQLNAKDAEIEKLKRQLCEYADGAEMLPDPDDASQRRGGE